MGTLRKDFILQTDWNEFGARALDAFCTAVVTEQVAVVSGRYTGTGRVQPLTFADLPRAPKVMVLQPAAGGTPVVTLVPYVTGAITAWSRTGCTLGVTSSNTAGTAYVYVVIA